MNIPTLNGTPLSFDDEIGHDAPPDCCSMPMSAMRPDADSHLTYTCGCCGIVVEVDGYGLVYDMRAKAAAG